MFAPPLLRRRQPATAGAAALPPRRPRSTQRSGPARPRCLLRAGSVTQRKRQAGIQACIPLYLCNQHKALHIQDSWAFEAVLARGLRVSMSMSPCHTRDVRQVPKPPLSLSDEEQRVAA